MAQSKSAALSIALTETRPVASVQDPTSTVRTDPPVVTSLVQKSNVDSYVTGAKAVQTKLTNQQILLALLKVKNKPVNTSGWSLEALPRVANDLSGNLRPVANNNTVPETGKAVLTYDIVAINRQSAATADVLLLGRLTVGPALSFSVKETEVNGPVSNPVVIAATQSGSASYVQTTTFVQATPASATALKASDAAYAAYTFTAVESGDLLGATNAAEKSLLSGLVTGLAGAFSGSATLVSTPSAVPAVRVPTFVAGAGKLSISTAPVGADEIRYSGSVAFSKSK